MCCYECFIYYKSIHYYLSTWRAINIKQLKDWSNNTQNWWYGEIESRIFKHIKIMYDLMVVTLTKQHNTWTLQQCFTVPPQIMRYRTGNVCYVVVINDQALSYPLRILVKIQKTRVQKYIFMSTETYHILQWMLDEHTKNAQYVQCVTHCLELIWLKNYTHVRRWCY